MAHSRITITLFDSLALLFVRAIVGLMAILPDPLAQFVARRIIRFICYLMPRLRPTGRQNLVFVFPEKSESEREQIFDRSLDFLADNLVGFAKGPHYTKERAARECDYTSACQAMEELHRRYPGVGVFVATMHFGAFERFLHIHTLLYRPASFLSRAFALPKFDNWWNRRREKTGSEMFGRMGGTAEMIARLRQGKDVFVLFDQNVKRKHAVFASFFGIPAATTKAVALSSLRTGAPVVVGANARLENGKIRPLVHIIGRCEDEVGDHDTKIRNFTERLHRAAEDIIRQYPEQWFWVHRRFKTRPEGEPETLYSNF